MGTFTITPETGEKYTLKVGTDSYALLQADSRAAVIHVAGGENTHSLQSRQAPWAIPAGAMLVVHTRGILKGVSPIAAGTPVRIPRERLGEGINQLLLIDADGNPLSERLVWTAPEE